MLNPFVVQGSNPLQRGTPDAILHLVDEATAEPLVCELETMPL